MTVLGELIGESAGIQAVRETLGRLLRRQSDGVRLPPVLIQGETGTGKGLLARLLHDAGPRRGGPFVGINCAAIPETLLEAELFGFERGAFTDARHAKAGLCQTAHRGTLFLDEIGLLPEPLQGKLLTVLEERVVRRLGSTRSEPIDVWILTASNADLATLMREGRFREDLFHRLAVVTVSLPPLRARGGDVTLLAEHFLGRAARDYALPLRTLGPDAGTALLAHPWPGNLRELANVMERVVLLTEAPVVTAAMLGLPAAVTPGPREELGVATAAARPLAETPSGDASADDPIERLERERDHLLAALQETRWNISRAAARLGIPRNTIRYRIRKHGLRPETPRPVARPLAPPAVAPPPPPKVVPPPVASAPAAFSGLRWEPRRLTLLRAMLMAPGGPVEPTADMSRAIEVLVEKVEAFGGWVAEVGRTGFVAAFGLAPIEDAAGRAAHGAMAMQKTSERARRVDPERPALSVALHAGSFPVAAAGGLPQIDLDAKREAWAVLEALSAAALPDTILVSPAAAAFLTRRFDLVPAGPAARGPGQPYRLAGLEPAGLGRRTAPLLGRRDELDLLRSRLALATRGHGQVVGLGGEAGIGKSRLLLEFRRSLPPESVTCLEGHCVSYGSAIPYLPLLDMLRQACGITEADPAEAVLEKAHGALRQLGMDPGEGAPYLLHLLGLREGAERLAALSPEAIHRRTFELLCEMSLQQSRRRPLVLTFEDLQWIDQASDTYLAFLVDSLAGAPILLLLTHRPGYRAGWMAKPYATQMALPPLAPDDSLSLVRAVLPADTVADDVIRQIVDTAEGNPFFLEELARAVVEPSGGTSVPTVPETIQDVLLARIDQLADGPKRLLQGAAVLGRVATRRLLDAVWEGPGPLEPHLRELTRLEFLYEGAEGDGPVYVFRHALTRDVARASLSPARRQALHLAAGVALEGLYADRVEEVEDRLAYHFSKAKQADKAVEYLTRLAAKAARSYAHVEAVAALEDGLAHVERLPAPERDRRRLGVVLRAAQSLSFLGRFQEGLERLLREEARIERLDLPSLAGPYYLWLAYTESHLGRHDRAIASARRALDEARRCRDEATMGKAHVVVAQESYWAGEPLQGLAAGDRAVERLERSGEQWWLGLAHWIVGINHVILGAFDAALEAEARALAIGESLGDPRLQSYATWSTGWVHALRGDAEAALEACRAALGRAPDPVNTAVAQGHLGYVHLERGDRAAVPLLEAAVGEMRRFGFRRLEGRFATFLGEAYLLDGRLEKARDLVRHGREVTAETGYRYGLGWAQHALGRIAHAAGAPAEAAAHLGDALRTFLGAQARFMTGRTQLTCAELSAARGDRAEAAARLREAHAVFRALAVPRYVERAARLAATLGLALPEGPAPSYVAVVRPGEDAVFATLAARRADLKVAEVVWDRRLGERRRQTRPVAVERRRGQRRVPPPGPSGAAAFFLSP